MKFRLVFLLLLCTLFVGFSTNEKKKIILYLAGDSTMQTYREEETPMRGWGQYLQEHFEDRVQVVNKAIGGRSTKTFLSEGRWQNLVNQLRKGDWVMIQFGHNDGSSKPERYTSPEDYRKNLERFVKEVQSKKAHPVLLTSICMRRFDEGGRLMNGLGDYPRITREVAAALQVPLIDLNQKTSSYISKLGAEGSKKAYLWLQAGEHPQYPDGLQDNTHLGELGARKVAALAAEGVRELKLKPLLKHLRELPRQEDL